MADWNGTDPVEVGMRLGVERKTGNQTWPRVTVLYISSFSLVGTDDDTGAERYWDLDDVNLITPLSERDEVIADMIAITGSNNPNCHQEFGALYDAGYRR